MPRQLPVSVRLRQSVSLCLLWLAELIPLFAQSAATITISHGEVTAGDPLEMVVAFDSPATCDQGVRVNLLNPETSQILYFQGPLLKGKNTATLTLGIQQTVPLDFRGKFSASFGDASLFPCKGYSANKPFTIAPVSVNVHGVQDSNIYPTKAEVGLTLTQRQFLETKIVVLNDLSGQIDTRVEHNGIDSLDLRSFLTGIVEKAQDELRVTEMQYRTILLKATDLPPPFFADFRRQYSALDVELKAPIPGMTFREGRAHLTYVQEPLRPRPEAGRNRSGTSPSIAKATKEILRDNASAYKAVAKTGNGRSPQFHARLESRPIGATIYYRHKIDPEFETWSSKTDILGADFDLATFIFKFHKDECTDEPVIEINPYEDTAPTIFAEFKHCRKK